MSQHNVETARAAALASSPWRVAPWWKFHDEWYLPIERGIPGEDFRSIALVQAKEQGDVEALAHASIIVAALDAVREVPALKQRLREWQDSYDRHVANQMHAENERQEELQRAFDVRDQALEMVKALASHLGDAHGSDRSAAHYGDERCQVCEDIESAHGLLEGKTPEPRVWVLVQDITPRLNRKIVDGDDEIYISRAVLIRYRLPESPEDFSVAVAYLDGDGEWRDEETGHPFTDVVQWMDIPLGVKIS